MEEVNIFVFGQSQEQIDNRFVMTTDSNKLLYNKIREELYDKSLKDKKHLNLYTTLERGLGFTSLVAGLSLNNEYGSVFKPVKINIVIPHNGFSASWDYKTASKYDDLIQFADSVRTASRSPQFVEEDWVKAGKSMVDNADLGIIVLPDIKPTYLTEVIRYAFHKNVPMIKVNSEDLSVSPVDLIDIMI